MRVLVTGASGFIGAHLCHTLIEAGHDVLGIVRQRAGAWRLDAFAKDCPTIEGDLADVSSLEPQVAQFAPEVLVHLGWSGVAGQSRNDASQALNVGMTAQILELGIKAGIKTFVGIGSQAEYGPHDGIIDQETATRPTTMYGEAKLAAAHLSFRLCHLASIRFAWLRVFSTYGPGDASHWLIPGTIEALRAGARPSFTECGQLWGFLHVLDAAQAIRMVVETPTAGGYYNLGSADAPSLRQTLETLRDLIDPSLELGFGDLPYRPDQVMHLQADIGPLQRETGWVPKVDLMTGLKDTIAWYAHAPSGRRG